LVFVFYYNSSEVQDLATCGSEFFEGIYTVFIVNSGLTYGVIVKNLHFCACAFQAGFNVCHYTH